MGLIHRHLNNQSRLTSFRQLARLKFVESSSAVASQSESYCLTEFKSLAEKGSGSATSFIWSEGRTE